MKWFCALSCLVFLGPACAPPWDVPDYDAIFVGDHLVEWEIQTSSTDWLRLIADPLSWPCSAGGLGPDCAVDEDCPATCRCFAGTCVTHYVEATVWVDGQALEPVGLRLMGTRRRAKRNMRIRFNQFVADQKFFGVKRINFRNCAGDPSLIREALALELMAAAGIPAPRHSFVRVSVNGDPGGIYTLVQQVDKKFLESYFGEDFGNLYKMERGGNLAYEGDDPALYDPPFYERYELKTNEEVADVADLIGLMRVAAGASFEDDLPGVLNTEAWLRWLAANSWLGNMDSYPGTADNLYLYHTASGRFRPVPWDLNQAFGNYHGPSCAMNTDDLYELDPFSPTCGGERPLVERMLASEQYRSEYAGQLRDLIEGALYPERTAALARDLHESIREEARQDLLKEFSDTEFEQALEDDIPAGDNPARVPGLLPYMTARDAICREALDRYRSGPDDGK